MALWIENETAPIKRLFIGIGESMGPIPNPEAAVNPLHRSHIVAGTYPSSNAIAGELNAFATLVAKYGVAVERPKPIANLPQIFMRDLGFVIGNRMVLANMIAARRREQAGITDLLDQIAPDRILTPPEEVRIEGGDIVLHQDKIFVGYSDATDFKNHRTARTNSAGVDYLREQFQDKTVVPIQLVKSEASHTENVMHLDCCFQPIGNNAAIIAPCGFKNPTDFKWLESQFESVLFLEPEERHLLQSNLFSISPDVIVSSPDFHRVNQALKALGFIVETTPFAETSKLAGLFRCSTLPLEREHF